VGRSSVRGRESATKARGRLLEVCRRCFPPTARLASDERLRVTTTTRSRWRLEAHTRFERFELPAFFGDRAVKTSCSSVRRAWVMGGRGGKGAAEPSGS
jgi:hypothetical protein